LDFLRSEQAANLPPAATDAARNAASTLAGYRLDGTVQRFISKVATLPHLSAAIASRGAVASLMLIGFEISKVAATFDDVVTSAPMVLRAAYNRGEFDWASGAKASWSWCWSEARHRAEAYLLSSVNHPGVEPFFFHQHESGADHAPLQRRELVSSLQRSAFTWLLCQHLGALLDQHMVASALAHVAEPNHIAVALAVLFPHRYYSPAE
jgi:hypothetical protein